MNVSGLDPAPTQRESFKRNRTKFVPDSSGCYVLTTFSQEVLYVGLAKSLRSRMTNHLDSPDKTNETPLGRAVFFYWIVDPDNETIERTWMNIHVQHEGAIPILNSVYSPVHI